MDARLGNEAITPRIGKPVEINALWITALDCMAEWASRCADDPAPYIVAAERAAASFTARFWHEAGGYLYDVIDGPEGDDASLRPNQLIALASRRRLVPVSAGLTALDRIDAELLTSYGLRSLSLHDPNYHGMCLGDQQARDRAYHQGTVWPWLLGSYVDACKRFGRNNQDLAGLLSAFHPHLREAGIGSISEIFDGDAPNAARGCIAQGWSVGEILRVLSGDSTP
jgi:predicted glycogen debranching enzyme